MRLRIALWASAGFLVAGGWALYFMWASKDDPIRLMYTLSQITCPIAIAGSYFPISLYWAVVANVATYALAGLIVESLRRRVHHAT